ncbi:MAG: O-acetyl-ADP-ribose deacetylase [Deltaproteobacteria bacterium]|nr:O-acetyl-ADP-ribose deacetylase [Deltaproteobacteria bacterium]
MEELKRFVDGKVVIMVGDLTKDKVDAIVNAANSSLMGGGGVDGAIHRAGGPEILRACEEIRKQEYPDGLPTGRAVITTAGKMLSKYVIHTVGPVYGRGGKEKANELAACYKNSLSLAAENGIETVAFPAISTGVYGYPQEEAAKVCSKAVQEFLSKESRVKQVHLVFFSQNDADVFLENHAFEGK